MKNEEAVISEKRTGKKNSHIAFTVVKIIVFVIFVVYAVSLIYPIVWAFFTSLKTQFEWQNQNRNGFPQQWLFGNYAKAFLEVSDNGVNMIMMFFNSIWYTVGGTLLGVFVSAMTAYVTAKYNFLGKKIVYGISVFVMMLPIVGAMPSQYKIYTGLGIINTPLIVLTFAAGVGFNFVVLYSFFQSLSWEYAEAAFIDGASDFRVFIQIMLPQTLSVILALCVVASINFWNDYMGPLLFMKNYPTLAAGLYLFQIHMTRHKDYPVYFAALLISMIPILVVFVIFQNTLMNMSVGGGLKG